MTFRLTRLICSSICLASLSLSHAVSAANTSGVHGPVINPNDRSFMFRNSFVPGEDGESDSSAIRLHYQQAMNESLRWRVISQFRSPDGEWEYDYLRAELLWYLTPDSDGAWDTAVRFDIRTRKGDRPETFAINWTNQWMLTPKWQLRGILIGGWDFGGNATGGTQLGTRASLMYKLDSGQKVGLEMFSEYGKLSDIGSWDEQEHQIGPAISGKFSDIKYQFGYLAGVSESADDHDFRIWFSKSF